MYVRCGYLIGRPSEANQKPFERALREDVLPLLRRLPKLLDARILWALEHEEGAPRLYATIELSFASAADWSTALASPERETMRARFLEILPMFEGQVSHVNHAVEAAG